MATSVVLRFLGDSASLDRTFKKVGAESATFGNKMSKGMALAGVSMAGAGIAAVGFAKSSVSAFKEAETAQNKLEDAFKRFPALADTNIAALRKLNTQLAQKTRFDDDATASGQAVLAGFKLTGAQITQLTPLLQDYAAKTGKDLPTAAQDLGKALNGQGRALKAIGINFKDTGSASGNLASLTDVLSQKVGGFAEREGKTAAGQAEIMKNRFGELQETIGAALIPVLSGLVAGLSSVLQWFQELSPAGQRVAQVVAALGAGLVVLIGVVKAYTAVQAALNVVLTANPIGLIIVALAALGAGFVLAYKHSETFRNVVQGVMKAIEAYLTPPRIAIELIIKALDKAWDIAKKVGSAVSKIKVPGQGLVGKGLDLLGFATGGTVPGPIGAPQLAVVHGGERVLTPSQQRSGGGATTVNIYMPPGSDGDDVVAAIARYERRNGTGWRASA